jgi:chaperonin GroEL
MIAASSGIRDQARKGLKNAASIASLMLTTKAMVAEIPEKKSAPAGPPGGHGGGMDY